MTSDHISLVTPENKEKINVFAKYIAAFPKNWNSGKKYRENRYWREN